MRRDFVANVSHELRTPVTAIRSAAETLRAGALTDAEAAPRFVDIVDRNAERLHHLVEDLLDLSRIESKQYALTFEPLAIAEAAEHTFAALREQAARKQQRLVLAVPADVPPVRADRRAVGQVLTNLVENAIKYCPDGTRITARARIEDGMVRVNIEDTGPGIDARHLPRLFERFYRVDPGRSRDQGGTGLGLSIVKHLIEAMGGEVGVESPFGQGTTFWFTLPRMARELPSEVTGPS
jgi:two-component system phosphate regulon sensor histidine kinase PhoR